MKRLKAINTDARVSVGYRSTIGVFALLDLLIACLLVNDIYGGGPGFVAVLQAMLLCAFTIYLIYTAAKRVYHGSGVNFGLAMVATVTALQQCIMWGGMTDNTFRQRLLELAPAILNATKASCVGDCASLNTTAVLDNIAIAPHQGGQEALMCVVQGVLFMLLVPYTIAQLLAKAPATESFSTNNNYLQLDGRSGTLLQPPNSVPLDEDAGAIAEF